MQQLCQDLLYPDYDLNLVGSWIISALFIEVLGYLLFLSLSQLIVIVFADPDGLLVPLEDGLDFSLLVGEPLVLKILFTFGTSDLGGAFKRHLLPVRVITF